MSKKRSLGSQIAIQIFLIFVLITVLFPILWVIAISLDARNISRPLKIPFLDPEWYANISIKPFINVLTNTQQGGNNVSYFRLLLNSLIAAGGTSFIVVSIATTAAYAFSHFRFPGRKAGLMTFI
ncbi:MAG: hypothetical protein MJB14_23225, partial [Spirochaetes bacterium]|nr:hypothetical protein [Spirochaetota bacterium]